MKVGFRSMYASFLVLLLCSAAGVGVLCAESSVQLSVRPEVGEVGQSLELSVTVSGAATVDSEPRLPPVDGLRFRRAGQQTNFSLVNGKMSRSITFQFVVLADKAGEYTLGPVDVQIGKETIRSGKVKLQVVAAGTPAPGRSSSRGTPGGAGSGEDGLVFVEADLDRSQVFLGEQVTLRLRFYQAVGFRVLETQLESPPTTQGFLREEIPPQRTSTASVDGRTYQVTELVYGLFPTQTGTLEIGPATLRCVVQDRRSRRGRRDPFDIFGLFEEREVTLRSQPKRVEVLPLPRPRPETFTGGVGSFRLQSEVDRVEVQQNEPVTLTLSVDGTGNVAAIGPPLVPEIPGFRTFDGAAPSVTPRKNDDRLGGRKTFQLVLVPETTGDLIIPPLEMSYFRTSNRRYIRLASDSVVVRVLPGTGGVNGEGVTRLGWDLREIREATELRPVGKSTLWSRPSFWLLQAGPLFLIAGGWVARRRREHERLHRDRLSRERAPGRLRKEIQALSRTKDDPAARLRSLDGIWTRYMEDRFGFPLRGRTRAELGERLREEGFGDEVVKDVGELLGALDFARFAPGDSVALEELFVRSRALAEKLERAGRVRPSGAPAPILFLTLLSALGVSLALLSFPSLAEESPALEDASGEIEFAVDSSSAVVLSEDGDSGASIEVGPEVAESWFHDGNEAFRAGDLERATGLYEAVLEAGYESPDVWLNLGNARFRAGERGRAVHAFESGRRIAPRDPDLRSNLELALRDVESAPESDGNPVLEALARSREHFPMRQTLPWFLALSWALGAWGAWIVYRGSVGRGLVLLGVLLGTVWLSGLAWIGVLTIQARTRPDGVAVVPSLSVRSNPDPKATVEFHLPEGTLFRTGRLAPGYVEVLYSDELRGWADAPSIARIGRP